MSSLTKAYRIKNTGAAQGGQTSTGPNPLTRVSKVSASLQNAKLPQMSATPKPIPNLPKFSELAALEYKDTLINTIIEEHLLKFGYLEAFDMFAYEADMIKKLHMLNENMNKKKTPGAVNASMGMSQSQLGGPPVSVRELQDTILKVNGDLPTRHLQTERTKLSSQTGNEY